MSAASFGRTHQSGVFPIPRAAVPTRARLTVAQWALLVELSDRGPMMMLPAERRTAKALRRRGLVECRPSGCWQLTQAGLERVVAGP